MDNFRITQFGKPLYKDTYVIDLDNKNFNTNEANLVLDFSGLNGWTFNTGGNCTFNTGGYCNFNTGNYCNINTGKCCTFNTRSNCTFKTGKCCTFKTGKCCTFMLWKINTCKFNTYDGVSIILDLDDKKRYVLNKELINMLKVIHG